MQVELRPRSFGENFSLALQLTAAHFVPLFLVFGILSSPQLVMMMLAQGPAASDEPSGVQVLALLATVVVMLLAAPVAAGAATAIVAQSFTGDRTGIGAALSVALSRLGSLLGYTIVTGLLIGIGSMLLLIPGLILTTWYYVGNPAIIVENRGVGEAMARSKELTAGKRWEVLGLFFVVAVVVQAVAAMVGAVIGFGLADAGSVVVTGISWVIGVAVGLLAVVAPVVMYFSLRCEKEGFDVSGLAALVDEIGRRGGGAAR